jgi:CheY-like chemotaxis protein
MDARRRNESVVGSHAASPATGACAGTSDIRSGDGRVRAIRKRELANRLSILRGYRGYLPATKLPATTAASFADRARQATPSLRSRITQPKRGRAMMAEVNILLVEDDEVDVMAVKHAFKELKIANQLFRAADGIDALEMIRGENGKKKLPRPFIVFLDLNMPRMGGLEFLDELRGDPELQRSIVFVMTTSAAEEDRIRAYDKCIAGYVLKHSAGHTFIDAMTMLEHYWRVVEFPER